MAVTKAVAVTYLPFNSNIAVNAQFYDGSTYVSEYNLAIPTSDYTDPATMKASAESLILGYAAAQGYTALTSASQIVWPQTAGLLSGAPQPAIADAPADAVTDYNVLTTLLGSLTGAVNTANAKQNEIATQLNTLLSELRTLGLIAS